MVGVLGTVTIDDGVHVEEEEEDEEDDDEDEVEEEGEKVEFDDAIE